MRPRSEQPVVTLVLRDLSDGPATVQDLEEAVMIDRRNLRKYMVLLHTDKKVHIGGWEQRTGPAVPVWHFGPGRDKQRPQPKRKRKPNAGQFLSTL